MTDPEPKKKVGEVAELGEKRSLDVGVETFDGEQVAAQAEAEALEVEQRAERLLLQVERDLGNGLDVDGGKAASAMQKVLQDMQGLHSSFMQRLREILAAPGKIIKMLKEDALYKELYILDNPKIIARILKELSAGKVPIEESAELFRRAKKGDLWKWQEVVKELDDALVKAISAEFARGQSEKALQLFDRLSERRQYSEEKTVANQLIKAEMSDLPPSMPDDLKSLIARRTAFEKAKDRISAACVLERWRLGSVCKNLYKQLPEQFFTPHEQFLSAQPQAAIERLSSLPVADQKTIISHWEANKEMHWAELLVDEEAERLIPIVLEFPQVNRYYPQTDKKTILYLQEKFSPAQRTAAWEKAGSPREVNWEIVKMYLVIGSASKSTPEQLKKLDKNSAQIIALTLEAVGEEKTIELWSDDTLEDLAESEIHPEYIRTSTNVEGITLRLQNLPEAVRRHLPTESSGGSGRKSDTRPGRVVWEHEGFQGMIPRVAHFLRLVDSVPTKYQTSVFAVLKPQRFESEYSSMEWISAAQAEHFLEFVQLTGAKEKVTFRDFSYLRHRFDSSSWEKIRAGVEKAMETGLPLLLEGELTAAHLDMYEKCVMPEHAEVNRFIQESAEQSTQFVEDSGYSPVEYHRSSLTPEEVLKMYTLSEVVKTYFAQDAEIVAEYLNLSDRDVMVIRALTDGKLADETHGKADQRVVAGVMVSVARRMNNVDEKTKNQLERFVGLTTNQKKCWNDLYKKMIWIGGSTDTENDQQLFALASSAEGPAILQFLDEAKLGLFCSDIALRMAERSDCKGLFYYVHQQQNREVTKEVVDQLIILKDAGLPARYELLRYDPQAAFEYETVVNLRKWNPELLAHVAQHAEQAYPDLLLKDLIRVHPSENGVDQPEQVIKERISLAALSQAGYVRVEPPAPGEIEFLRNRIEVAQAALGDSVGRRERDKLVYIPSKVWDRFSAQPQILRLYLEGPHHYFSVNELVLSDEVLTDPVIWKYSLPDAAWIDPGMMQTIRELIPVLEVAVPDFIEHNTIQPNLISVFAKAPWMFSVDSVAVLEKPNQLSIETFAELSESEWSEVRPQVAQFRFESTHEASEFLALWRAGESVVPETALQELLQSVRRIPWKQAKELAGRLAAGGTVEGMVKEKDQEVVVESWYERRPEWYRERQALLLDKITTIDPEFSVKSEMTVAVLVALSTASVQTLRRFQEVYVHNGSSEYIQNRCRQYLLIAEHPNYQNISEVFQLKGFSTSFLFDKSEPIVTKFLESVNPELLDHLRTWPHPLRLNLEDAADFFAHPRADEILVFAKELQAQFGQNVDMSVYDLLLLNAEDIQRFRALPAKSFFPVTPKGLQVYVMAAEGAERVTVQKMISSFDHQDLIDVALVFDDLKALSPELRMAVLKHKVGNTFGWSILKERNAILGELGISQDQYDELIRIQYRAGSRGIPFCDLPMARAILSDPVYSREADRIECMKIIIPKFVGELESLFEIAQVSGSIDVFIQEVVRKQFKDLETDQVNATELMLTDENWRLVVMAYVRTTTDHTHLPNADQKISAQAVELFKHADAKDFVLKKLNQLWQAQLASDSPEKPSFDLVVLTNFVKQCGGAGLMSQFEALALFVDMFGGVALRAKTADRTVTEMTSGMRAMEDRFTQEKWSNDDRADFYHISRDIIQAAPSLYAEFMEAFKKMKPADIKRFANEVYPLYRAQLAVVGQTSVTQGEPRKYNARDLVKVRASMKEFAKTGKPDAARVAQLKKELIADIGGRFKERFGIAKIPEAFTAEHIRSLSNITMYLANIAHRTSGKEKTVGLYLSLMINNKWDAFRRGEVVDAAGYLSEDEARQMGELLKRRAELNPLTAERMGIQAEELPEFQTMLQRESSAITVGTVETVDVKLMNVMTNLRRLEDPDLYPDPMDRERLALLMEFGNKRIGAVAAKMYLETTPAGANIVFSAQEAVVKERMVRMLAVAGIPITGELVKALLQEEMKPLAVVTNILKFIEETKAQEGVETLRELLHPTDQVVQVFNRLGEEFKPASGALALSQDLDYLDNIIVKRQDELTPEEIKTLREYVARIREQVVKLQAVYDQIKAKFTAVRGSMNTGRNELLSAKLAEIEKIINTQASELSVTSNMTHNLNSIMENIRECLSCMRQGCNNDTDLTFGDSNKFFVYSHTAEQSKGSIADQIVFLEPVTVVGKEPEMSFVFDRVYGNCTPFILTNHITAVFKKYRAIKQKFPEAKLSILVTQAAISTASMDTEALQKSLQAQFGAEVKITPTEAEVDVVESATGNHYIEFGGMSRSSGKRVVNGLSISL